MDEIEQEKETKEGGRVYVQYCVYSYYHTHNVRPSRVLKEMFYVKLR